MKLDASDKAEKAHEVADAMRDGELDLIKATLFNDARIGKLPHTICDPDGTRWEKGIDGNHEFVTFIFNLVATVKEARYAEHNERGKIALMAAMGNNIYDEVIENFEDYAYQQLKEKS